jgi:hypothetical protein
MVLCSILDTNLSNRREARGKKRRRRERTMKVGKKIKLYCRRISNGVQGC